MRFVVRLRLTRGSLRTFPIMFTRTLAEANACAEQLNKAIAEALCRESLTVRIQRVRKKVKT